MFTREEWKNAKQLGIFLLLVSLVVFVIWIKPGPKPPPPPPTPEELMIEHAKSKGVPQDRIDYARDMIVYTTAIVEGKKDDRTTPENAYAMRAKAYIILWQFDKAMEDFRTARAKFPKTYADWIGHGEDGALHLPSALAERGEYDRAIDLYEILLKDHSEDSGFGYWYGVFLTTTKHDALRDLRRGIQLIRLHVEKHEKDHEAQMKLATALAVNGDFDEAVRHLDKFVAIYSEYREKVHRNLQASIERKKNAEDIAFAERNLQEVQQDFALRLEKTAETRAAFLRKEKPTLASRY
jgi:tetratricopeptide (TPR) repeat protein